MGAKRRLGRSNLELTSIGFGGGPVGWLDAPDALEVTTATVAAAWQSGIRYFDTAPYYGFGNSERRLGKFLRSLPRNQFVLSSKVGRLIRPCFAGDTSSEQAVLDYSRDGAMRSIEESLVRLGIASIDIALIHDIDGWTHGDQQPRRFAEALDGAYRALADLKSNGLVGAIGLGVNEWRVCQAFAERAPVDCILLAGRLTLLEREPEQTFLPFCEERGIGVIVGGPFNSGILATGSSEQARYNYAPATPSILAQVRALEAICTSFRVPLAAAALAYPLRHAAVASVIPGIATPGEVAAMQKWTASPIPPEFWPELASHWQTKV